MSSTTGTKQQVAQRLQQKHDQLDKLAKPEEVRAQVNLLPLTTVYEARYALEAIKGEIPDGMEFEVIEPLARVIGWAEASAYFASTFQNNNVSGFNGVNSK